MDFKFIFHAIFISARYIPITLLIATSALVLGIIFGLFIALVDYYKVPVVRPIFKIVITILKGIPLVLFLIASYLFASDWFDHFAQTYHLSIGFKDIPPMFIAIFALSIFSTVNFSENFRGALKSISKRQIDAGYSIGYSRWQLTRRILLPQSFANVLPYSTSLYIGLIKGTALVSLISVIDILQGSLIAGSMRNLYLESYIAAAIVYWVVNGVIEVLGRKLENRLAKKRGRVLAV